jgi:hypothetical protein
MAPDRALRNPVVNIMRRPSEIVAHVEFSLILHFSFYWPITPMVIMLTDIAHFDLKSGWIAGCIGQNTPFEGIATNVHCTTPPIAVCIQ